MKPVPTQQKLRGGYYTPKPIAAFLARWAIQHAHAEVLEPSCGDGALLEAAVAALREKGADALAISQLLHGIETDADEAQQAANRLRQLGLPPNPDQIWIGDFFSYCQSHLMGQQLFNPSGRQFDAIIGNPPFIRYQTFPEQHRANAFELMRQIGLRPNRLTNSWVPFLVVGAHLLRDRGRLAMVIPAELFQVSYAAETRRFLSDYFSHITLVTFRSLLFDGVQQEVVLVLAEKNDGQSSEIRTVEVDGVDDLEFMDQPALARAESKPMDHSTEKWTQYFLSKDEILLLRTLRASPSLMRTADVMDVDVGVVTGENHFFLVTEQQAENLNLMPYVHKIVSRSAHLRGTLFSEQDWAENARSQLPVLLFSPPPAPLRSLSEDARRYIAQGEVAGYNRGYKCRTREPWYSVPSIWTPDAFMLRQVHAYPKLVVNGTQATCTDTVHRVKFKDRSQGRSVTAAFLNSLTFAFAEVTGRSYGGGVLTFEPSEAESLPLPLAGVDAIDFAQIDAMVRSGSMDKLLDVTDAALLQRGLGLDSCEISTLRAIWVKLRDRRVNRRRNGNGLNGANPH